MLDLQLANKKQTAARFSCGLFILFASITFPMGFGVPDHLSPA